jgi:hypothetical protein
VIYGQSPRKLVEGRAEIVNDLAEYQTEVERRRAAFDKHEVGITLGIEAGLETHGVGGGESFTVQPQLACMLDGSHKLAS